jgi:ABC-type transport system involved in multi-copper enzyme maturation permease subunit
MKACVALLHHSARRVRSLVLATAGLLALFQILFTLAAESLQEFNAYDRLAALVPDVFRQLLGPSVITIMSFKGIACLGYFHVAIVAVLVGLAIAIATEPAIEAESRFLDLILAHPVARHWVITRSIALLTGSIAVVVAAMMLGNRVGLYWLAPGDVGQEAFSIVPELSLNLAVLLLCWGAIALAAASIARRRSVAGAVTGLLAMVCYLADVISQVWKPLKPMARFSPFHYYNSLNLIMGSGDATRDIVILACVAACCFLLAYLLFSRRDLQ